MQRDRRRVCNTASTSAQSAGFAPQHAARPSGGRRALSPIHPVVPVTRDHALVWTAYFAQQEPYGVSVSAEAHLCYFAYKIMGKEI